MSTGVHICIARTEFWKRDAIFTPHPLPPPQFLHAGRRWIPRIRNWRGMRIVEKPAAELETRGARSADECRGVLGRADPASGASACCAALRSPTYAQQGSISEYSV